MAGSVKKLFGIAIFSLSLAVAGAASAEEAGPPAHWDGRKVPIYSDPVTGYAIRGFDPVAYFTDGEARRGDRRYELEWRGAYWIFANSGNRAAFEANPEIYAPRFGGYGAVSMADGALAEAAPEIFVVHEDQLFLFAGTRQRAAFEQDPAYFIARGERAWLVARGFDPQRIAAQIAAAEAAKAAEASAQATNPETEQPPVPEL